MTMKTYARIADGVVAETLTIDAELDIAEMFHPDLIWVECTKIKGIAQGWTYADGKFAAPVVALPTAGELVAYANGKQWALATGGFTITTIGGRPLTFDTSPTGQALITGKWARFQAANPPESADWQFSGGFVSVSASDFVSAAIGVADFVQATFDALKVVEGEIAAGTITTTDEIDAYAWPSNAAAA